jgi:hypothetical protein
MKGRYNTMKRKNYGKPLGLILIYKIPGVEFIYTIPEERMDAADRVIKTYLQDEDFGITYQEATIRAMPVLKRVFEAEALKRHNLSYTPYSFMEAL